MQKLTASVWHIWLASLLVATSPANADDTDGDQTNTAMPEAIPDIRADELKIKWQERNWFVVPIPLSNPTTDAGLVVGGAYFYPQTEEQKKHQPASVTGAAGYYSSNDSAAFGIAHQSYWKKNKWRFSGVVAAADLRLGLTAPGISGAQNVDWSVEGVIVGATVSRKISGNWYAGIFARYLDIDEEFGVGFSTAEFNTAATTVSSGVGLKLERDSRDNPFNPNAGSILKLSGLRNAGTFGSDDTYSSYDASFRSYHLLSKSVVLAWEVQGCHRSGLMPLWDACMIDLRGFSAIDYLGRTSASAQIEARWQFHEKWGAVAFAGGGNYDNSFSGLRENDIIPSVGVGLRFMVLKSQQINMRLDYGQSKDSDAIYLSVGEAF